MNAEFAQYFLPCAKKAFSEIESRFAFLDFFAGSGLVSQALKKYFRVAWANDICAKKAAVYKANHKNAPFYLCSITSINGKTLPECSLSWASFPCQDLSLAGNTAGIRAKRSGLVWEWLRVMDEMEKQPPILAAENVTGLFSADAGANYKELHKALLKRGYRAGAVLLDAADWLPQSRPRIFIAAVAENIDLPSDLVSSGPTWAHSTAIKKVARNLNGWIWWNLPKPEKRTSKLSDLIDFSLECHDKFVSEKNLAMIPPAHMQKLQESGLKVVPGYKRIRNRQQVLELRFDETAGCLRTPTGGSSRQYLVMKYGEEWRTRILSPREAARLMGAPEEFLLPGSFNDGYKAMGDAVAVPVVAYLAKHLLLPLVELCSDHA